MVVAVTVVVASVLGFFAYRFSQGQTQALTIQLAIQPDLNPLLAQNLENYATDQDRRTLLAIVGGILALVITVGLTGIVITHRVVGPVYKMKRLFSEVARGSLRVEERLRKGDELQDLFDAFAHMLDVLRERQQRIHSELESVATGSQLNADAQTSLAKAKSELEKLIG